MPKLHSPFAIISRTLLFPAWRLLLLLLPSSSLIIGASAMPGFTHFQLISDCRRALFLLLLPSSSLIMGADLASPPKKVSTICWQAAYSLSVEAHTFTILPSARAPTRRQAATAKNAVNFVACILSLSLSCLKNERSLSLSLCVTFA